jgi:hypothetical protein
VEGHITGVEYSEPDARGGGFFGRCSGRERGAVLMETAYQWRVALYTLLGGLLLGLLYDLFRAVRRLLRTGRIATAMMDALYCLLALPVAFFILWRAADMALRPYMLAGMGLGAAVYFAGPSVFLMKGWMALLRALRRTAGRLRDTRFVRWLTR